MLITYSLFRSEPKWKRGTKTINKNVIQICAYNDLILVYEYIIYLLVEKKVYNLTMLMGKDVYNSELWGHEHFKLNQGGKNKEALV